MTSTEHRATYQPVKAVTAVRDTTSRWSRPVATTQWLVHCPACGESTMRGGSRDAVEVFIAEHYAEHHGPPPVDPHPDHEITSRRVLNRTGEHRIDCRCGLGWTGTADSAEQAMAEHLAQHQPPATPPTRARVATARRLQ
jgi:hypothetical protein